MLVENNKIVLKDETIANVMNSYFTNSTTLILNLKPTKIDPKVNL